MARRVEQGCLGHPDHLDSLVQGANLGSMVLLDPQDQKVLMESQAKLEQREMEDQRGTGGPRVPEVSLDPLEMQGREVPEGSEVRQGHRVLWESLGLLEAGVCQGLTGQWAPRVRVGTEGPRGRMDPKVDLGTWADLELQGFKGSEGLLAGWDLEGPGDPWASLGTMARMVRQGSQASRESQGGQGPWGPLGTRDLLEIRVSRGLRGFPVSKVPEEMQAKMGSQGGLVPQGQLGPQETGVLQALLDPGVSRACLDQLAKMDSLEMMGLLAFRVLLG